MALGSSEYAIHRKPKLPIFISLIVDIQAPYWPCKLGAYQSCQRLRPGFPLLISSECLFCSTLCIDENSSHPTCVQVPVIANGNIQSLQDVKDCMEVSGVEGVS